MARSFFSVAVYGALLFWPAGTFFWGRAWAILALVFVAMVFTGTWLLRNDQGLLQERRKPPLQAGQPLADRVLTIAFIVIFPAYLVLIPLDVFRLHLCVKPPLPISVIGFAACLAGALIIALTLRENAFAAAIVKHQLERQHVVVSTGLYRFVRHPMYSGLLLWIVGAALWLESYGAAIASVVPDLLLVTRIVIEERFLRQNLTGYGAYLERVRYRILPFVW